MNTSPLFNNTFIHKLIPKCVLLSFLLDYENKYKYKCAFKNLLSKCLKKVSNVSNGSLQNVTYESSYKATKCLRGGINFIQYIIFYTQPDGNITHFFQYNETIGESVK